MNLLSLPRVAVIGLGAFGRAHAESLRSLGGASLCAIVEPDPGRRGEAKAALAVSAVFSSLEELIHAKAADAVVIATRSSTHVPLALQALEAGLHVLVEKPAGQDEAELRTLLQRQRECGRVVMVDHLCLFHSLVCPLVERVRKAGFRAAHFARHRPAAIAARFPEAHPVDLLMVHDLYLAAQMTRGEEPDTFHLMESRGHGGGIDMTWAALRWPDGRTAIFHSHCVLPPGAPADGFDRMEIFGDGYHSAIETNPAAWNWTAERSEWPVGLEISSVHGRPVGMLAEAQRAFLASLAGAPVPSGCRVEDALQVQRWITRIKQSSQRYDRA